MNDQKKGVAQGRGYRQSNVWVSSGTNEISCPFRCELVTRQPVENLLIDQTALKIIDHLESVKSGQVPNDEDSNSIKISLPTKQFPPCENCVKSEKKVDS